MGLGLDMARSVGREYLEALLIAVIFATFARTYVVQAFKIPTGSMEQNLQIGDHILVNKFVYGTRFGLVEELLLPARSVRRGDVVVFKYPPEPSRDFIKRCVALSGDTIEIINKVVHVNGEPVIEDGYTFHADQRTYPNSVFLADEYRERDNFGPLEVPEGHLFFLGDNRDNSNDSRFWGPVPESHVKGRAFLVYWSFAPELEETEANGFLGRLRRMSQIVVGLFSKTRWDRSFQIVR